METAPQVHANGVDFLWIFRWTTGQPPSCHKFYCKLWISLLMSSKWDACMYKLASVCCCMHLWRWTRVSYSTFRGHGATVLIFWIIFVPPRSILINFPAAIRCWTVSYWTSLMIILWSLLNNLSHDLWLFQGWKAFSCCCGIGPHHDSFMFSTGTGVSERKSKLSLRVMAVTVWGPWVSVHPWPFPYLIRGDHWHGQRIWCYGMHGP